MKSNQNQCTIPQKWLHDKAYWQLFAELTAKTDSISFTDSIEQDIQSFTDFIIDAATQAVLKSLSNIKKRSVP